jgi:hypothetical protein
MTVKYWFLVRICFIVALISIPNISANAKWIQNGTTAAGGNGAGSGLNQLSNHMVYILMKTKLFT